MTDSHTRGSSQAGLDLAPDRNGHPPHMGDGHTVTHLARHSAVRWAPAIAGSLLLHLGGAVLLNHMMTGGNGTDGSAHASNTLLVINLEQQGEISRPGSISAGRPHSHARPVPTSSVGAVATGGISSLAETYFPLSELDVMPEIQRDIDLNGEEIGRQHERGGSIQLTLWIDESGRVVKAEAEESSDLPPVVGDVAAKAFLQATFRPGIRNGIAVKSRARLMVVVSASVDS